ncbi:MAG: ABC transporter permease [Robiginitomaculum sp.]|nr:ABC transporter permease [Robiginitomaculum sp.]
MTQAVLHLTPWFRPQYLIPLAGMIFAGNMNWVHTLVEKPKLNLKRTKLLNSGKRGLYARCLTH